MNENEKFRDLFKTTLLRMNAALKEEKEEKKEFDKPIYDPNR